VTDPNPFSREQALAALAWLHEAGVDTTVDEIPRDWLVEGAEPASNGPEARVEEPRREPPRGEVPRVEPPKGDPGAIEAARTLDELRAAVEAIRARPTFADGDPTSRVMIVGQDPSADDMPTGRPFSGPSGALLDRMLAAIGLDRTRCYLTNLILWRNPGGRPPSDEELDAGARALKRHVALVAPRALLIMGGAPAKTLLDTAAGITKLRGRWVNLEIDGVAVPALPTFNPAYLLRMPQHKGLAWVDLLSFKERLRGD
jgi:DNA polymerase